MKKKQILLALAAASLLVGCGQKTPVAPASSSAASTKGTASSSEVQKVTYTITFLAGEHTTIALAEGYTKTVQEGAAFQFTVTADAHYHVAEVKANNEVLSPNESGVYLIPSVTADLVISSRAEIDSFAITIPSDDHYVVTPLAGYDPAKVGYGDDFKFKVEATLPYRLTSVKAGGEALSADGEGVYTIASVTQNMAIEVAVEQIFLKVTMPPSNEQYDIAVSGEINLAKVLYGTEVKFTVTPKDGYQIDEVKAGEQKLTKAEDGSYSFAVEKDVTITIAASLLHETISLEEGEHAHIAAAEGYDASFVSYGADFKFTVSADEHWHIVSVKVAGNEIFETGKSTYTIPNVTANTTISVRAEEDTYAINVTQGEHYQITLQSKGTKLESVKYSEDVAFSAVAEEGYSITAFLINGAEATIGEDGFYHVKNRTGATTVSATTEIQTFQVTFNGDATRYEVEAPGADAVAWGSGLTFKITPKAGYYITSVKLGEEPLVAGSDGSYTIKAIKSNLAVSIDASKEYVHHAARAASEAKRGYYEFWEKYDGTYTLSSPGDVYDEATGEADTSSWESTDARWSSDTLAGDRQGIQVADWDGSASKFVSGNSAGWQIYLRGYTPTEANGYAIDSMKVGEIHLTWTKGTAKNGGTFFTLSGLENLPADRSGDGQHTIEVSMTKNGKAFTLYVPVIFYTFVLWNNNYNQFRLWVARDDVKDVAHFGYYLLGRDFTPDTGNGTQFTNKAEATECRSSSWADYGFRGTLDGGGHTIKMTSGDKGAFALLGRGATIRNVVFEDVSYNRASANSILASYCHGASIENCTFKLDATTGAAADLLSDDNRYKTIEYNGWIFSRGMSETSFKNCTFDASGLDLDCLFGGASVIDGKTTYTALNNTFENCTVKAKSLTCLASNGEDKLADGTWRRRYIGWESFQSDANLDKAKWAEHGLTFVPTDTAA